MEIKDALVQLDPADDGAWTSDGLPRIDVVEKMVGRRIKRGDITQASPEFHRAVAAKLKKDEPSNGDTDSGQGDVKAAEAAPVDPVVEADEPEDGDVAVTAETPAADPTAELEPTQLPTVDMDARREQLMAKREQVSRFLADSQKKAAKANQEVKRLSDEVNDLNRQIERIEKSDPDHNSRAIRAYLASQRKTREAKALQSREFLEKAGVTPAQVAKQLDPRAPIDQAMRQRKPPLGSQRPVRR